MLRKIRFFSLILFFLCIAQAKKEKYHKRKKPALIKRNSKVFYQRFCRDKRNRSGLTNGNAQCEQLRSGAANGRFQDSYGQNLLKTQLFLINVPSGLRPETRDGSQSEPLCSSSNSQNNFVICKSVSLLNHPAL